MNSDALVGQPWRGQHVRHRYDLFGLTFECEEPIPGIGPCAMAPAENIITIEFGAVPREIANAQFVNRAVQASASEYLLVLPGLLGLYAQADRRIVVERLGGWDSIRLWTVVLGTGASIAGLRRGYIPLHASCILTQNGCIAFAGQSGAGKSTLAANLVKRGFGLFAEDLCLVQWHGGGDPIVGQGISQLRLKDDAVTALDWADIEPFAIHPGTNKSVFHHDPLEQRSAALRRIYALEFATESAKSGIYPLSGVEAMQMLLGLLRIRLGVLTTGERQRTFESLAAISDKVEIFRFVRPRDHGQAPYWLDRLSEHFAS